MQDLQQPAQIHPYFSQGILFVAFEGSLTKDFIEGTSQKILHLVQQRASKMVVIDLSDTTFIDVSAAHALDNIGGMLNAAGCKTILSGMKSQIASALVELGHSFRFFQFSSSIDNSIKLLNTENTYE